VFILLETIANCPKSGAAWQMPNNEGKFHE